MDDSKLKNEAPLLFSLRRKNIYQVPENFFSDMGNDFQKQCAERKPDRTKILRRQIELSVAAAVVGFIFFLGVKIIAGKEYLPVETDRAIYNINDGDADGDRTVVIDSFENQ